MLAGILINSYVSIVISIINALLVFFAYMTVSATLQEAASPSVPIIAFIFLLALISWLYQRTLNQSFERLSVARQQLTRDALLRQELAIARDLQSRLYPAPPETDSRLQIASVVLPAMETSGDLYDFIELGPDELGIVIADVTGKSLAAALVMAMARSTFRSEARRTTDPAEVLTQVNAILCSDHSVKQMLTAWYGILNTSTLNPTLRQCRAPVSNPQARRHRDRARHPRPAAAGPPRHGLPRASDRAAGRRRSAADQRWRG